MQSIPENVDFSNTSIVTILFALTRMSNNAGMAVSPNNQIGKINQQIKPKINQITRRQHSNQQIFNQLIPLTKVGFNGKVFLHGCVGTIVWNFGVFFLPTRRYMSKFSLSKPPTARASLRAMMLPRTIPTRIFDCYRIRERERERKHSIIHQIFHL